DVPAVITCDLQSRSLDLTTPALARRIHRIYATRRAGGFLLMQASSRRSRMTRPGPRPTPTRATAMLVAAAALAGCAGGTIEGGSSEDSATALAGATTRTLTLRTASAGKY